MEATKLTNWLSPSNSPNRPGWLDTFRSSYVIEDVSYELLRLAATNSPVPQSMTTEVFGLIWRQGLIQGTGAACGDQDSYHVTPTGFRTILRKNGLIPNWPDSGIHTHPRTGQDLVEYAAVLAGWAKAVEHFGSWCMWEDGIGEIVDGEFHTDPTGNPDWTKLLRRARTKRLATLIAGLNADRIGIRLRSVTRKGVLFVRPETTVQTTGWYGHMGVYECKRTKTFYGPLWQNQVTTTTRPPWDRESTFDTYSTLPEMELFAPWSDLYENPGLVLFWDEADKAAF